jgi:hypothetical protein
MASVHALVHFELGVAANRNAELIDDVVRSEHGRAPARRPAVHPAALPVATWRKHDA